MRKNLPVTGVKYPLRDDVAIVSKTDLKGKITYVNPYFIEVSGFTEDELLGATHNLVRHPDMSAEAFADLWDALKAGIPWTGLVKNQRKNGGYYWVQAHRLTQSVAMFRLSRHERHQVVPARSLTTNSMPLTTRARRA